MNKHECDHKFVRDGEVVRSPMRDYTQWWHRYFCERCLTTRFALVKSQHNGYYTHHDGSRIVERLEDA